ncbi:ABC transporter ATP-binding protein [Andreprevotia chitinilytica]|uniref:ABC transporter ATP-binding protein n=1 Tax=Andreprevotia chitinilytica TaxID=396808 RepID=UPI00054EA823|nr:ATP-binding cassette domain-containing protein [Andreprevotia chitinilytica]
MTEPIIRVENLTCAYGDETILRDVSFTVETGEVFVILGGSGCGKSTLLRHMIGLERPKTGQVWLTGEELTATEGPARQALMRKFGVAYQSGALFGSMSVLDNVLLPLVNFTQLDRSACELVARLKLRQVGLEAYADYSPAELSGGMQKRAAIARAMALDPKILFLDEPSAGLDPVTAAELDALINQLAQTLGLTFVVVTHELASIFAIADRALMLDKGAKGAIALDTPEQLRDQPPSDAVRRFFHREINKEMA